MACGTCKNGIEEEWWDWGAVDCARCKDMSNMEWDEYFIHEGEGCPYYEPKEEAKNDVRFEGKQ